MRYRVFLCSGLMVMTLVACKPPAPTSYKSASELMQVPVVLGIEGGRLSSRVNVENGILTVTATVAEDAEWQPHQLHVITQGGVWSAPAHLDAGEAVARGQAANLRAGERVQVVMSFEDEEGKPRLLRDENVVVE